MKKKHLLKEMTCVEFKERMAEEPVMLVPLGSIEEQGPVAPMGDYMLTERVAEQIAEQADAIAAPTTPFGYAEYFRCMPGGVQLQADTFCAVLQDICENFLSHGLRRIVILNGHGGNLPLIQKTLYNLKKKHSVWIPCIPLWKSITEQTWKEVHPELGTKAFAHGGDPMTSMYLHFYPELTRMDLAAAPQRNNVLGLPTAGLDTIIHNGMRVSVPIEVCDLSDNGSIGGDTSHSSAEKGEKLVERVVSTAADFIRYFKTVNPNTQTEK
jgi:creatinine amidohydrolase